MAKNWKVKDRQFAKLLTSWTGWVFERTPLSGGLRWKKDQRIAGDVVCEHQYADDWPFSVELKTHKIQSAIAIHHLFINPEENLLVRFWLQAVKDAHKTKRIPWLSFRVDNAMPKLMYLVAWPMDLAELLSKKTYVPVRLRIPEMQISIFSSEDLFRVPFKRIQKIIKTYNKQGGYHAQTKDLEKYKELEQRKTERKKGKNRAGKNQESC